MNKVAFINYRRDDAGAEAHSIAKTLRDNLGKDSVFMDSSSIQSGKIWPEHIRSALTETRYILVVKGPNWLKAGMDEWGQRRIDDESDWVRQEIGMALRDDTKTIIPLLVNGARMPPKNVLPQDICDICSRHAIEIRRDYFDHDIQPLVAQIHDSVTADNSVALARSNEAFFSECRSAILEQANEHIALINSLHSYDANFEATFVCPPLSTKPAKQKNIIAKENSQRPSLISPSDIILDSGDYIISGETESGKTCLSFHLAILFIDHSSYKLPAVLDFSVLKPNTNSIIKSVTSFYAGLVDKVIVREYLSTGRCVFIADNFDVTQKSHIRIASFASSQWPSCRWIFLTSGLAQTDFLPERHKSICTLNKIFIWPLTRGNIRSIIEPWCSARDREPSEVLNYVVRWLTRHRLPRTAFIIYLLLNAMQQKSTHNMFNEGVLLDAMLETLLKKIRIIKA